MESTHDLNQVWACPRANSYLYLYFRQVDETQGDAMLKILSERSLGDTHFTYKPVYLSCLPT